MIQLKQPEREKSLFAGAAHVSLTYNEGQQGDIILSLGAKRMIPGSFINYLSTI